MNARKRDILLIILCGALLYLPFNGQTNLFDWDEVNFAEAAREMLVSGKYDQVQINFSPFMEKPPFFFWLQATSFKIFGIGSFGARFPNAIAGILTLLLLYFLGTRLRSKKFGSIWALLYLGSFVPLIYFKSGIIDPVYNLLTFAGLSSIYLAIDKKSNPLAISGGALLGLALITKGPALIGIVGLSLLLFYLRKRDGAKLISWHPMLSLLSFIVVGSLWYLYEYIMHGSEFISNFVNYQFRLFNTEDAGHAGPLWYHPLVVLLGCLPFSIYALPRLFRLKQEGFESLMRLAFWITMILFSIVQTKIIHYSSFCWIPLSFLGAIQIEKSIRMQKPMPALPNVLIFFLSTIGLVLISIPFLGSRIDQWRHLVSDKFLFENLNQNIHYGFMDAVPGLILIFGIVFMYHCDKQRKFYLGAKGLFLSVALTAFTAYVILLPKAEKYSQRSLVNFFEKHSPTDSYKQVIEMKSYIPYFYGRVSKDGDPNQVFKHWLIGGEIDKDVYLAARITSKEHISRTYPQLQFLYEENGYVFYMREAAMD